MTTTTSNPNDQALKDLVTLVCKVANTLVGAPKPLTASVLLTDLFPDIGPVETLVGEAGQIPAELKDLDQAVVQDLLATIQSTLSLSDVKAEAVATAAMQVIGAALSLATALKS